MSPTKPKKILALTRYERLGASSRLRFFQYAEFLGKSGLDVSFSPLFDNDYVSTLHSKPVSIVSVLKAYWHRLVVLCTSTKFDVLWVEKEALPFIPSFFELLLIPKSAVLVLDYDDAWFHRYDRHRMSWVRTLLGRKIDKIMARADLVIAGNEYLAQRACEAGAAHVHLLPTVVDLHRYPLEWRDFSRSPLVVGWMGSPSTARYLEPLFPIAERLIHEYSVRFVAVGAMAEQVAGSAFEAVPWTEDAEIDQLRSFDIGVMPLPDEPWERGKCGYKLIQYMASGLPVIASPVGINRSLVTQGGNGCLASTPDEWYRALVSLLESAEARRQFGDMGRCRVSSEYCLDVTAKKLFHDLSGGKKLVK